MQYLAAPQAAVVTHAQAVERDADHLGVIDVYAVVAEAAGDVRVMMLGGLEQQILLRGPVAPELGRDVFRVFVDHQGFGLKGVQRFVEFEVVLVVLEGACVFQVAHVLREDGLAVFDQAEGVFQFATEREQTVGLFKAGRQRELCRGIATCTS